ncbi:MAG: transketolase [Candidatus Eremiobacterota bacterium]
MEHLKELARTLRLHVLRMTHRARSSHVGSSFSMAELIAVLYGHALRVRPDEPNWPERDRFVLSKGHACAVVYAALAERGFFPVDWLDTYYLDGSKLAGHITHKDVPGVEASTGSLGHGLSLALGMALAGKWDQKTYRVFAMLSDGELDEGSNWEPILLAPHLGLDNLTVLVDYNKIQSLGRVDEVMPLDPLADKFRSFGWACREVDGHDVEAVLDALTRLPYEPGKPSCLVAHTVKGKGVSFMEDRLIWHYYSPDEKEYAAAVAELGASR